MKPEMITCPCRVNGPAHHAGLRGDNVYTCLEDLIVVVEVSGLKLKG